jgi:BirA family biotin operon repressor/biotin-[acetyl-CoA-carboxylase] ligase
MLSEHALSHALELVGLRAPVRFDEVTRSTQETALQMAAEGAPEWTLVATAHQTQGRGRLGRSWVDEPGHALLFSLVLRPDLAAERGGLIPLLAGTSLAQACEDLTGRRATCKWPNDVLVGRRKVAGILVESRLIGDRLEHAALGVGVNLGPPPADLPDAGAVDAPDVDLLEAFLGIFVRRYEPGHPAFPGAVAAAYRERCATIGERVRATTVDGASVEGDAVDVDELGGLVVRTEDGLEVVRFGEVEHLG